MDRRDISKALMGIAAATGASAIAQKAQAQTCTAPCFAPTSAETAAGVTPVNTQYSPSHIGDDVRRYGNIDLTGATDCSSILATANSVGTSLYFPPGNYRISNNLTLSVPLFFDYGAILIPDSDVTLTINAAIWAGPWQIFNVGYLTNDVLQLQGVLQPMNYEGAVLVEWFGGGKTGSTDDSTYFNQALQVAANSGNIVVRLLAKNYPIARTVYMAGNSTAASDLPCLWGAGSSGGSGTIITASGAISTIIANGTNSSNILKAGIKDILFVGNGSDTAITLYGTDYYDIERCTFYLSSVGVLFSGTGSANGGPIVYTEFCRAVKCSFVNCSTTAVHWSTTNTEFISFNGCGLQDSFIALGSATQNALRIDNPANMYNAPLSFMCWTGANAATLIVNNSTALQSCHGVITVEGGSSPSNGSAAVPIVLAGGSGIPINFAGKINISSTACISGNFLQADVVQTNGTVMTIYGGRKTTTFPLTTGTTQESFNLLGGTQRMVTLEITNTAQTYYYRAVLLVLSQNTGFTGQVTLLSSYLVTDSGSIAYGVPTITYGSGTTNGIAITNSRYPPSGVVAVLESLQIGTTPINLNYTGNDGYAYL